jgi:hypothetical protein
MIESLLKKLDSGNATEREEVIRALIALDSDGARHSLRKIASNDFEFPYLREMARNALGLRIKAQPSKITPAKYRIPTELRKDPEADFLLYYIRVTYNGRKFYKIGVTTTGVANRYREEFSKIDKVLYEERVVGALKAEQDVLADFKKHLFPLGIFRNSNGFTEFFDIDVLGLDR